MTSGDQSSGSQSAFFSESGELGGAHLQFNEICTALYERELINLANQVPATPLRLKRRLAGLPHHVRSVARYLVANPTPMDIDPHNGSWFIKQPGSCPGQTQTAEQINQWYHKHSDYGLVVPVVVTSVHGTTIELDSIDKIQQENATLHANKHGWFTFEGEYQGNAADVYTTQSLLKPTKAIMASACCGHTWRNKSKSAPRAISLREMRLSTKINWKSFTL